MNVTDWSARLAQSSLGNEACPLRYEMVQELVVASWLLLWILLGRCLSEYHEASACIVPVPDRVLNYSGTKHCLQQIDCA